MAVWGYLTFPFAAAGADDFPDLTKFKLQELVRMDVTSVSKRPEPWFESPAAVYVITGEDIRRSGVTSIPEALRMAPGVDVARNDASTWAMGVRGFNDVFNSKLLVLIDGRTVNSPFIGGVEWDVRDTPLEDIDRIEVIRGPGGTLWGNNAVNGVINIITKPAKDTQGLLVTGGGGTEERVFGSLRYGGRIDDETFFRVYTEYFNREDLVLSNGDEARDGWHMVHGGFRVDWERAAAHLFTVEGDIYNGEERAITPVTILTPPFTQVLSNNIVPAGGHLLGRWTHTLPDNSETKLQVYYDRTERSAANYSETRDTVDIDSQYRFPLGTRQEIVCGLGYRLQHDEIGSTFASSWDPDSRTMNLFNVYGQDEIELVRKRLSLTVGTKVEHNDFTGFEIEPSARLKWTPTANQTVWAAVSRAVSTPSRSEHDQRVNAQAFPTNSTVALISFFGNPDLQSESVLAYELGYRLQPHPRLWFDVATFYNMYDHLLSLEPGSPSPEGSHLLIPFTDDDKLDGESYGAEVAARWQAAAWWRLDATYSYTQVELHPTHGSQDTIVTPAEGKSPRHQVMVRSALDLPRHVQLDTMLRFVDALPTVGIPSYFSLDVRLGWQATPNLELSVVGQNLLDDHHPEFAQSTFTQPTEVPRGVYGKVTWRY